MATLHIYDIYRICHKGLLDAGHRDELIYRLEVVKTPSNL